MFRYVKLKNYKSLVDLNVDFTEKKDTPKKLILIYGENGAGKSNFASSFFTLSEIIRTKSNKEILDKITEDMIAKKKNIPVENVIKILKGGLKEIENIIKECKTIGSKDNMLLEFGFRINDKNGVYKFETDNEKIVYEKLDFVYNKNSVTFFEIDNNNIKINENVINKKSYYNELTELTEKYFGKHSFISILNSEIADKRLKFIEENINSSLLDVIKFLDNICIQVNENSSIRGKINNSDIMLKIPEYKKGEINKDEEHKLDTTEELLNIFFTYLYSDIKKVYYKKELIKQKIHYQLYVKKLIYNNLIEMSFDNESTGTQQLLRLFPFLIDSVCGETEIVDEFDSGIHDILVKNIIENVYPSIKGQLILTTHNTYLLESDIPKECMYSFKLDSFANKELSPMTSIDGERIHPNLNVRKRYLNGTYKGTPMPMSLDFDEFAEMFEN